MKMDAAVLSQLVAARMSEARSCAHVTAIASLDPGEQADLLKELHAVEPGRAPFLSFLMGTRKCGNPCNQMRSFLDSVLEMTDEVEGIEILARIDQDDDLYYYRDIRREYAGRLNLRFVVGDRGRGYEDLHRFVHELVAHISPSSMAIFGCSDDSYLAKKGWDSSARQVIRHYPDNLFFVNSGRNLKMPYDNLEAFFRSLWTMGPSAPFPIIGRRVFEIIQETVAPLEGWTTFGNSVMADSFFEAIQMYLWRVAGVQRTVQLQGIICQHVEVISGAHKEGNPWQHPIAIRSYQEFVTPQTQKVIMSIARALAGQVSC